MKKIILIALVIGLGKLGAQSFVADFESFTLAPNSAYSSTNSVPFQTSNGIFQHQESAPYWIGGFAYTNVVDSTNPGPANMYGVRAYNGYNGSGKWVVGQDRGIIKMIPPYNQVDGFYVTNTTYAWKSIKKGDNFARKFGDTTGTNTGTLYAQGSYPDYFKLTVKGYAGGNLKNDSVVFFLADYTFTNNAQDYAVNTWQYVNTSTLGYVDSLKFFLYSSDMSGPYLNTPAYFAIDNFASTAIAGIHELSAAWGSGIYPNPFHSFLNLDLSAETNIRIMDISSRQVYSTITSGKTSLDLESLQKGIYFVELNDGKNVFVKKLVKE